MRAKRVKLKAICFATADTAETEKRIIIKLSLCGGVSELY
jgi:hypothetical protein